MEETDLEQAVRTEGARVLATLVRTVGDLHLAEDAVQEAVLRALRDWPVHGVPAEPRAWLTVAARRAAIDVIRRERARADKEREGVELVELHRPDPPPDSVVRDDRLRLLFTCCHPALSLEAGVTLALRVLCGLTPAQIASVLLMSEAAVAKRLTRTRSKIAAAAIPYRVPDDAELPDRLPGVCAVVHAVFTAAHTAQDGDAVSDVDGCAEALRLARLVHELLPDEPMPAAVLALVLLTEARRPARTDADGRVVPLTEQDRGLWDAGMVAEGERLLADSLRRTQGVADPYQLLAAVAAVHDRAPDWDATDWDEVVRLYDLLLSVAPSAPAALARAVAVAERDGPDAGLTALDGVAAEDEPTRRRVDAVRGELLARAGRYPEAVAATTASLAGPVSAPERAHRERRLAEWASARADGRP